MQRGFTLVELLVVIAIIGILSSVVLVALNMARENARISAAKQQATVIDRALGSEAVGWIDFDECTGTSVFDRAGGYAVNITTAVWSTDTPSGRGCSLSFTGTNWAYVSGDKDIMDVRTGSATRTVWFKTTQTTHSYLFRKGDGGGNNGMHIEIGAVTPGTLRCRAKYTAASATAELPAAYNDGKWHFAACVVNRQKGTITLMVDGSAQATGDASFLAGQDLNSTDNAFFPNSGPAYTGLLDEVRMYASVLSLAQVEELYAEGLRKAVAEAQ